MSEHTPEPWTVRETDGVEKQTVSFGIMAGDVWLGELCEGTDRRDLQQRGWLPVETARANARRLTACVNTCRDVPTEALEALQPGWWQRNAELRMQNAELLAACQTALALVEELEPEVLDGRDDVPGLLRAAIARTRGETPPA
jgi:hypothetical protein